MCQLERSRGRSKLSAVIAGMAAWGMPAASAAPGAAAQAPQQAACRISSLIFSSLQGREERCEVTRHPKALPVMLAELLDPSASRHGNLEHT